MNQQGIYLFGRNNYKKLFLYPCLTILIMLQLVPISGFCEGDKNTKASISTIDPPHWWTGFKNPQLQLCVHGNNIGLTVPSITYAGVTIENVTRTTNKNYLFITINIADNTRPGKMVLQFSGGKKILSHIYELKKRNNKQQGHQGLSSADAIYLLMPDRFANGDEKNDIITSMNCRTINRKSFIDRHGGDLAGIIQHLDYIHSLGFTALWLNPVMENNQPQESYHGYALTNHYKIDERLGTNSLYKQLAEECHSRKMKLIHDIVLNHVGNEHYLIQDLPDSSFIHQWRTFTRTTYKDGTLMDPYASLADRKLLTDGWFDTHMPDLNQQNPLVSNYLVQNSIWLIEEFDLDAFRIDTYAYCDLDFEKHWAEKIKTEFPSFFLFAETWVHGITNQAFFAQNKIATAEPSSDLDGVTDFQLYYATNDAISQPFGWTEGVNRWYHTLCGDYIYSHPSTNILFLDNHDLSRYWSVCGKDMDKFKMGITFIATSRGIPAVYYGTELLLENFADSKSSNVRPDFPGGWKGDSLNLFVQSNLNNEQAEAQKYIAKLFNYRMHTPALATGRLMQFVPQDGIYVYFRYNDDTTIMVIFNSNQTVKELELERFSELIPASVYVKNIITETVTLADKKISLPQKSSMVLEIMKIK